MVQAYKGRFKRIESGVWLPSRENKHKGSLIVGKVSDVNVFDEHGKLVDHHPGGYNTISSGASYQLLAMAFFPIWSGANGASYSDVNGYLFPNWYNLNGGVAPGASSYFYGYSGFDRLFSTVWGIKGGAAGLASHQSTITNINVGWGLTWNTNSADWMNNHNGSWSMGGSISNTTSATQYNGAGTNSNVPAISWNMTITSTSGATAYSIDSIGWLPNQNGSPTYYQACTTSAISTTKNLTAWGSGSSTPTQIADQVAISALYVLPYTVTVNPGGAVQFTYTFQGA